MDLRVQMARLLPKRRFFQEKVHNSRDGFDILDDFRVEKLLFDLNFPMDTPPSWSYCRVGTLEDAVTIEERLVGMAKIRNCKRISSFSV